MRKTLLVGAAALGLLAMPAAALDTSSWSTYIGGDYQYVLPSYKSGLGVAMPLLSDGFNFHIGERLGPYYAVELGYMSGVGEKNGAVMVSGVSTPFTTHVSVAGPTLDLYGYLPLFHSPVSLFGTIGGSYLDGSAKVTIGTVETNASKSEIGYRVGGGIEWRPSNIFGIRGSVRYQSADFDGLASNAIITGIDFNFYF